MTLQVVVIVGPTACGKTRLGVEAAHRLGSEIISADSRQVYRGLDIGTGKDLGEYSRVEPPVPYHLIDVVDPEEVYTIFRFQQDCYRVLEDLAAKPPFADGGAPVFMVGGSGLYVEAIVRDYRLADVPVNRESTARTGRASAPGARRTPPGRGARSGRRNRPSKRPPRDPGSRDRRVFEKFAGAVQRPPFSAG